MAGSIAPFVQAYQWRSKNLPGPSRGTSAVEGTSFLPDELVDARLVALIAFGADHSLSPLTWVWEDFTNDIIQTRNGVEAIRINSIGRPNEFGVAPPASLALTLKNGAVEPGIPMKGPAAYTAHHRGSPNWPNLKQNTPIWIRLFVGGQYYTRFMGYVDAFTPIIDETGISSKVALTASGVSRYKSQGNTPLRSPLSRAILALNPVAYYPFTDPPGSTALVNLAHSDNPMFYSPSTTEPITLSAVTGPDGDTAALPEYNSFSSTFSGDVLASSLTRSTGNSWTADAVFRVETASVADGGFIVFQILTATTLWYVLVQDTPSANLILFIVDPVVQSTVFASATSIAVNPIDSQWHHLRVTCSQSGVNCTATAFLDDVSIANTTFAMTPGPVTIVRPVTIDNEVGSASSGHYAIYSGTSVSSVLTAFRGYTNDSPIARMARLCGQEIIPFVFISPYVSDKVMGPQPTDTFMNIMRQAELLDSGFLFDGGTIQVASPPLSASGFIYQGISARYNAADTMTLDASTGDLVPPFAPNDDDYGRVNVMTVSREGGASATVRDDTSELGTTAVGTYDSTLPGSLNAFSDIDLYSRASWEVWKGTRPGFRYSQITIDLRRKPALISSWLLARPGVAATITPPYSSTLPTDPIRVVFEGWSEMISKFWWRATINCSRGNVYDVYEIGDATLGRFVSDGHTILAQMNQGDTTFQLVTPSSACVATDSATVPGDFPLDINLDGLQMTVSSITGTTSPQTVTLSAGVSRMIPAGTAVDVWMPGVIKL